MPRPREIPVARGDRVTVAVDGLGDGPDGLARIGDYVLFVPGVLPGERAEIVVTSAARKFGRGELLAVHDPSPERVTPRCAHFLACGGCHRQHQDYPAQLRSKQERLQRAVTFALGDDAPAVAATVPAAAPYGERHKVVAHLLHGDDGRLGAALHRARSPELVAVHECPASDALAWDLVERTIELLDRLGHRAWDPWFAPRELLRSVLVRATTTGDAHLLIVATQERVPGLERIADDLHRAGATSIGVNHNDGDPAALLGGNTTHVSGRPFITERIAGLTWRISPTSFFQTSPRMAERLVQHVVDWLQPTRDDDVLDLFCGVGLLTLPLAQRARTATGIERHGAAIDDARGSAGDNGIRNATFRAGHADGWLQAARSGGIPRPHLIALDPPRTGLEPGIIADLARLRPRRLAYVSCEPAALQRDLPALRDAGFRTQALVPFDMFAQTCHVESLACLELCR